MTTVGRLSFKPTPRSNSTYQQCGELTALIRAFQWILAQPIPSVEGSQGYNIYTDSDYSQKCLLFPRKTPHSNQQLIQQARQLLDQVRTRSSIAIIWTKAHSRAIPALSIGNKAADSLAMKGHQLPLACSLSPCHHQVRDSGAVGVDHL